MNVLIAIYQIYKTFNNNFDFFHIISNQIIEKYE